MKKTDPRYKLWKKYQDEKNLIIRTKRKKIKKKTYSKKRVVYQQIEAPENLSLIYNSEETSSYFNKAIRILKNKETKNKVSTLLFNCKNVQFLSIDALMYLLAIIKNFKNVNFIF